MQRVEVKWVDSGLARSDGWEHRDAFVGNMKIGTVLTAGYLMHEDEERVIVANTYDSDNEAFMNAMAIYRPSIISITTLRPRKVMKPNKNVGGWNVEMFDSDTPDVV